MLERRNHHLFQRLLYQVATAGLSPADIAVPVRSVLRNHDKHTDLPSEVVPKFMFSLFSFGTP